MASPSPASRSRPGRPRGATGIVLAPVLRHPHFSFVRAALEMPGPLRPAWERYLAYEGGPADERHCAARLRELVRRIHDAARERGLEPLALRALGSWSARARTAPATTLPSLEAWIAERCAASGLDPDAFSQAEWLAEYREAFDLDRRPAPQPAAGAAPAPTVDRVRELNELASALARPADAGDALAAWLSPSLADRLARTRVDGRVLPLLTLGDLIGFVGLRHHRWWTAVPGLGQRRASRLMDWLVPLAAALGRPFAAPATLPHARLVLARQAALDRLAPESRRQFGLVPLDRLDVPPALDGRGGRFRSATPNTLGAGDDRSALLAWLRRYEASPRTHAAYARVAERFYLWCLLVRRLPLASVVEDDVRAYQAFCRQPPADWVQARRASRAAAQWRPFKGSLGAASLRLEIGVVAGLLGALVEAGYMSANAARGVLPSVRLPERRIDIDRSFDEASWSWLLRCWRTLHDASRGERAASLRRTRLVLELGATTGLRLVELATTRRGALTQELVDGRPVWILRVLGKGRRVREVPVFDDVKAWIDRHHNDLRAAGTDFDPTNPNLRGLRPDALPSPAATADPALLPLVGALRQAPPRWRLDARGVATLDRESPRNADRHGAIDPTALYQALKRFFRRAAAMARAEGAAVDADRLERASTHWLRHFFANSAAADRVDLSALKEALGHASLQTTSVYVRAERARVVGELARLRRRGEFSGP